MNSNVIAVTLVLVVFFVISFITNILGPIFPSLIADFDISLTLAGFFPFAFFAAYGVMSIPAGILVERYGEKPTMLLAFSLSCIGTLAFACWPTFAIAMLALFCIGTGMAMLQVAINPLLRVAGGESHFAFFSVMAQLLFAGAAAISPLVFSYFVQTLSEPNTNHLSHQVLGAVVPANMPWVAMYWLFAAISFALILVVTVTPLPKVNRAKAEQLGSLQVHLQLLKNSNVRLYFFAIAAYVATEQGVANGISLFLQTYHDVDPVTLGAQVVSDFWLMLTLGCAVGLVLLKLVDSRHILFVFSAGAIAALILALLGNKTTAMLAFPAVGFCLSVMWSIIFSLALNSVPKHHGSFSGILCTGIIGGALASPIIGLIADLTGSLKLGLTFNLLTLLFILSVGLWAKPLINNDRFKWKRQQLKPSECNSKS